MKKIKKFRVASRPASILRGVRSLLGATSVADLDARLEQEIPRAAAFFATAAVYDTFGADHFPDWAQELKAQKNEAGALPVAVTYFAATIGPALEAELAAALTRGDTLLGQILTAVGEDGADQVANFVGRLINDEAKEDACEISPRVEASGDLRQTVLQSLGAEKIGVQMDDQGRMTPRFTRVGHILWWPPVKRKK